MTTTRANRMRALALAVAGAAAAVLSFALVVSRPAPAHAQTASASGGAVSLTPASRTVRRGGQVLLNGHAASGGASSSSGGSVRINLRKGKRWAPVASASTDQSGDFSACVPVRVPGNARVARIQAAAPNGATSTVSVRVSTKGSSGCQDNSGAGQPATPQPDPQSSQPSYHDPLSPAPNPNCPLAQPGSQIGMSLPSACTVVSSDTADVTNPLGFWGKADCQTSDRYQQVGSGGDGHVTALGQSQGSSAYRQISVVDGDDQWGERCELGFNWHQASDPGYGITGPGPTVLYHEGERRVTYMSVRLPSNWDVNAPDWRVLMQMKQAQPFDNPQMSSMFEMDQMNGVWLIESAWNTVWTAPAKTNTWTRFAFDVTYSGNPNVGSIKIYVDLNNDGDFSDGGEQSPVTHKATLLTEVAGGPNGDVPPGGSIPSHLREGIYQNQNYNCPPPNGCSADFDNVQVVRA
jgi:hypothetical protein